MPSSRRGLILEGVTGAGKSSTLAALARCAERPPWLAEARLVTEEETLGLPTLVLDTTAMEWDAVARRIAAFCRE